MPIYGYTCDSCKHSFDVLQKMSDPRLLDCPECGEASLRKQMSAPKFRLKGNGWYETDFKTGDKRNLAAESDKKPAGDSGDSDKSGDTDKPAKKDETKTVETKKVEAKTTEKKPSTDSKASSA